MKKATCTVEIVETKDLKKNRIEYLDIARTFAIISVVLCHAVELIYNMDVQEWNRISVQAKLFRTIAFSVGRLGVPIFLFITGYLLLNRKYEDDNDVKKFYRKNLLPLIVTTEIWIVTYNIFISIYNNKIFNICSLIKEMLFIDQVPVSNMWYMPMIIGLYIIIPYLSRVLHTFSISVLKYPIILLFILAFILPTLNIILRTFKLEQYSNILDISFLGGTYGIYIINGYLISNQIMKKIKTKWILFLAIIFFILSCAIQIFEYYNLIRYNIWYSSPFIFLCALNLFELFTRIKTDKIHRKILDMFTYVAKISLSIYFIHIIVEKILYNYIKNFKFSNSIKVIILFVISFAFSVLMSWLLSGIKIIKTKILLIKD